MRPPFNPRCALVFTGNHVPSPFWSTTGFWREAYRDRTYPQFTGKWIFSGLRPEIYRGSDWVYR